MSYAAHSTDFHGHVAPRAKTGRSVFASLRRVVGGFFGAVLESREREAERAIGAYLERTGGRFTDSIEREINDRQFNGGWNLRR